MSCDRPDFTVGVTPVCINASYACYCMEMPACPFENPEDYLNLSELQQYAAITLPKRRREWFYGRLLVKHIYKSQFCAANYRDLEVVVLPNGAPMISDAGNIRSCSISHSADLVVAAVCSDVSGSVGVDVEKISDKAVRLKRKFYSSEEFLHPGRTPQEEATTVWCIKEAVSKMLGEGWQMGFKRTVCRETASGLFDVANPSGKYFHVRTARIGDYVVAVV